MVSSDGQKIAAIFGTVFIDNDKYKEDINGPVLDEHGEKQPIYETINFTTALKNVEHFTEIAQGLIVEALTLKNMKIAEKNGELSHFIESVGGAAPKAPRGFRNTISDTKYLKTKAPKAKIEPRKKSK